MIAALDTKSMLMGDSPVVGMGLPLTVAGWEYRLYIGTPQTSPIKWYNVSHWASLDTIAESVRALGQTSQLRLALLAELGGVSIAAVPRNGMELLFYKHHLTDPNQHEYLFGGKIKVRKRRASAENQIYAVTCYDFGYEKNRQITDITWTGVTHDTDKDRILDLFSKGFAGSGLSWDADNQVQQLTSYPSSDVTTWRKRSIDFILGTILVYQGQPGDPGYPLAPRRLKISVYWQLPGSPGADDNRLVRQLHYYSAESIQVERVPLTDSEDGLANYNSSSFTGPDSATDIGKGANLATL